MNSEKEIDDGKHPTENRWKHTIYARLLSRSKISFDEETIGKRHEYPLSTHKWFIDWLFRGYISYRIRAKNTIRDAMRCDAMYTFDKRLKQASEREQAFALFMLIILHHFFQIHRSIVLRESIRYFVCTAAE